MKTKYPEQVKMYIDFLNNFYEEDDNIKDFHILHMYPKELAYPNGYYDSRFFELVGYNDNLKKFKKLGNHDGLTFDKGVVLDIARIFADGSTLLRFKKNVGVRLYGAAEIFDFGNE
jgi:hypothetical protein